MSSGYSSLIVANYAFIRFFVFFFLAEDGIRYFHVTGVQTCALPIYTAVLNFAQVMAKRLTITGSTLRPQSIEAKARIAADLTREVWPLLDAGRIAPVMGETFPLEDAAAAHARMESSGHIGKNVMEVGLRKAPSNARSTRIKHAKVLFK